MPSDINLDIVLFAKHLLNILVEAKVNSKGAFSKGDLYEFQWCPWHSASAEVSIGEDKRSHKGPDVEKEAEPAGTDAGVNELVYCSRSLLRVSGGPTAPLWGNGRYLAPLCCPLPPTLTEDAILCS